MKLTVHTPLGTFITHLPEDAPREEAEQMIKKLLTAASDKTLEYIRLDNVIQGCVPVGTMFLPRGIANQSVFLLEGGEWSRPRSSATMLASSTCA